MVGGGGQKRSLTRLMQGLELCPWFSPDGAGVWSQQGLQDGAALAVAAFRVYAPPPRLPLFAFSGATSAGSRSSGLRQQGRAGQLQGEVVNSPKRWTYKPSCAGGQDGR